jgi:hypothetical protein
MKTQEYKESTIINKGIGKETLKRKFESTEIEGQRVYFDFNLCENVEKFNFIKDSMLEYVEVILLTELIFSGVSLLWSDFESSLKLIPHSNINLKSVLKKEVMMRNIKSIYLVNMKDETDCHSFFSNIFEEQKMELFVERNQYFCLSVFEIEIETEIKIEIERIFGMRIGGNDYCFGLKRPEISESPMSLQAAGTVKIKMKAL